MSKKKYVPQGTYLACDKGTVPQEFKITNNNNSFLFDEPIANTGDLLPSTNVMPFGTCSVTGSACAPAPIMWQGFEDGIFIGNFNPLLEDSILPCSVGGKIEIFYSLEDAQAACGDDGMSFWEIVAVAVLVVAAVALVVISGGAALAAIGAIAAATTTTGVVVGSLVLTAEVAGMYFGAKAIYDYAQDGDEEALFREVALGYLFLGAGKLLEKGFRAWKAARAGDEIANIARESLKTKPNSAFFWSGRTSGVGGQHVALDIASERGGTTLEGLIESRKINMPEWDMANPESIKAWEDVSRIYAEGVSGEVRAVVGSELRAGNVWENIELPRLMANENVTKITTIDPVTQIEKIIFIR